MDQEELQKQVTGYYINLDSRNDRCEHFEQNIKCHPFLANVQRMSAILISTRGIGCTLSHIECLRMIKQSRTQMDESTFPKYYIIMEDDFCILDNDKFHHFVHDFDNVKDLDLWDVIVLTPSGQKEIVNNEMTSNNFLKILNTQTATAYIFKSHMIDVLLDNFIHSYIELINTNNYEKFALDQYWKRLQSQYGFYYYNKLFGGQLAGWSNLENRYVDYNYGFLNQET
jgi:GR25 family glycosyltransferase involved in LPS biosynthesis